MATKVAAPVGDGLKAYYQGKIEELEVAARDKAATLRRLEAQRNELNSKGREKRRWGPCCLVLFVFHRCGTKAPKSF